MRHDLVDALIDAVLSFDATQRDKVVAQFASEGVPNAAVVDRYIPAAARKLGAAWCEDTMSFADVTIGVARLQSILRDLRARQVTDAAAPGVLVVTVKDAYHTLGASVVADQLRRLGVAPTMAMGLTASELAELVESHDFNAVLISASATERLETLRELVNCVRTASRVDTPIVVGGTVTDIDTDIRTLTGADYVSNNAEEALRACGLMIQQPVVEPPGNRG
ncbi:MAG: cobalamin B12-binding domain-containing protein [Pseudomonadota bacterium]